MKIFRFLIILAQYCPWDISKRGRRKTLSLNYWEYWEAIFGTTKFGGIWQTNRNAVRAIQQVQNDILQAKDYILPKERHNCMAQNDSSLKLFSYSRYAYLYNHIYIQNHLHHVHDISYHKSYMEESWRDTERIHRRDDNKLAGVKKMCQDMLRPACISVFSISYMLHL